MPDAPTTPSHDAPTPARSGGGGAAAAKVAAVGAVAGTAALAWALFEAQWFVLRHLHLTGVVHGSPRPLRILHLSDLHVSQPGGRMGDFITSLVDEDYDLVVVTGDLLGDASMEDDTVAMLAPLTASGTPGVVVLGSNDFHAPVARNPLGYLVAPTTSTDDEDPLGPRLDTDRLVAGLAREGFTTLRNEVVTVTTAKGEVVVSGLDDPHTGAPLPDARDVASTAQGIAHLGLVHSPYKAALDLRVGVGADLVLAGHTHGGQVRVPGVGALVTNSDLPPAQARGLSRHRNVPLHVSAGLGTSKYAPIRFACRPEATLLTLLP
jgi:predicted MPP superfamily phosphohydrolase